MLPSRLPGGWQGPRCVAVGSGTQQQQQQHDYAHDTCCFLLAQQTHATDVCCVSDVFGLLYAVASHDWAPIFGWGPTRTTCEMEASDKSPISNFGPARFVNRFSDADTLIFGSRNGVRPSLIIAYPKQKMNVFGSQILSSYIV